MKKRTERGVFQTLHPILGKEETRLLIENGTAWIGDTEYHRCLLHISASSRWYEFELASKDWALPLKPGTFSLRKVWEIRRRLDGQGFKELPD